MQDSSFDCISHFQASRPLDELLQYSLISRSQGQRDAAHIQQESQSGLAGEKTGDIHTNAAGQQHLAQIPEAVQPGILADAVHTPSLLQSF